MRDWKGTLQKGKIAGLITLGVIVSGTGYYQAGKFITEKVETVQHEIKAYQAMEKQQTMALIKIAVELQRQQGATAKEVMETMKKMQTEAMETVSKKMESHMVYTVTGKTDSDHYFQTINGAGEEVWLTDIETSNMNLKKGDQVKMVLNSYGELVSIMKVTN